jgi:hypothetical protein
MASKPAASPSAAGNGEAGAENAPPASLLQKIHEVYKEIKAVKETGAAHYGSYADENDIYKELRPKFAKHGVLLFPSLVSKTTEGRMDSLIFEFEFVDVDTGESIAKRWAGAAEHVPNGDGERGAATYAMRTFLAKAFHIPTEDPGSSKASGSATAKPRPSASGTRSSAGSATGGAKPKTMPSKHPGTCKKCGERFDKGTEVIIGEWDHAVCPSAQSDVPVPEDVVQELKEQLNATEERDDLPF